MKKMATLFLILTIILTLGLTPAFASENLIANGGFESGNMGFSSDYTYVDTASRSGGMYGLGSMDPEQRYAIGTNPWDYHQSWSSYAAHGGSNMMIVNATPTKPEKTVWQQEVTIPACTAVQDFTLYAGQKWEIGEVLVKNDVAGKICIKFVLTDETALEEGWLITEAHVAVAKAAKDIPQKNGNPIPGQFPIKVKLNPGVTETDWYCLDYEWNASEPLVIAVHAKIERPAEYVDEPFCIYSGTDAQVGMNLAALAWVHPLWNPSLTMDLSPAQWIWDGYHPADPFGGNIVEFTQDFNLTGTPVAGTLSITADNGFEAYLNGTRLGDSGNLYGDWRNSDLSEAYIDTGAGVSSWATVRNFDASSLLRSSNRLAVTGVNEQMDGGTVESNPAGVIYKLCGTQRIMTSSHASETGWGGDGEFSGKNWAKYITYTPHVCSNNYEFSFWAANSHPDNPAVLKVEVNGTEIGGLAYLNTINPLTATWKEYKFTFTAAPGSAVIKIIDTFTVAQGDDFALDDISLVKAP